jgi:hypothetical protein
MKNTFFLLLSIFVILIAGCNKDEPVACTDETNPECPNYDPCHDAESTSADFETACIVVSDKYQKITSQEDTFYLGANIQFTAKQEDVLSYEWKIGDDDRVFTEQSFSLTFNPSDSVILFNRPVPIRLIVTRTPNTSCFPADDGIDTLTKYIYFVSIHEVSHKKFLGTWVGSREDKPDEIYEIEITDTPAIYLISGIPSFYKLVLKNLDNDGDGTCIMQQSSGGVRYNNFYIYSFISPNYSMCQPINVSGPYGVYGNIDELGNLRMKWKQ